MNPVRNATQFVTEHAQHVQIHSEHVERVAHAFSKTHKTPPIWGAPFHYVSDDKERQLAWLFLVDSMNFCFWTDGQRRFRCRQFAATMKQLFETTITEHPFHFFRDISYENFCDLFNDDGVLQLKRERWKHGRLISEFFLNNYNGHVQQFIEETGYSAPNLVEAIVSLLPSFHDNATYNKKLIPFHKRAQLLVSDIWGANTTSHPITNMEYLTAFADYRVPQLLHSFNILSYTPELESHIAHKKHIASGSAEEVEIRSATVQAVDMITRLLPDSFLPFHTDWLLWNEASSAVMLIPHHRTVTTAY